MNIGNLQRLLRPRHIAAVGGAIAAEVIRQCDRIGFDGEIWPVNPGLESIEGYRCYASVEQLPDAPDASFIAVPRETTVAVVGALSERRAGGAVCYASGFAELDAQGARLQQELVEAARGLAVVGPNCYGVLNYLDGACLWPDSHGGRAADRGVAIVTQSGNMGMSMTMQRRSLPLAYMVSVGNQACLGIHDYIEAFIDDERIQAIGLHIEGFTDIGAFCAAALKARHRGVPIVALKTGGSDLGRQVTLSHTSALAASDDIVDALFARLGVARAYSIPEFLETLKLLCVVGPLPDHRVASISCSGGEAALVADLVERHGLVLPALGETQRRRLGEILGERVALSNPLDYHTYIWGNAEAQERCFTAMVDGSQDLTLSILDYPIPETGDVQEWDLTVTAFINAVRNTRTRGAVVSTLPESLPEQVRDTLLAAGVAPMQGLDDCLRAVKAAAAIGRVQRVPVPERAVLAVGTIDVDHSVLLDEWRSKQTLREAGLTVPEGHLVSAEQAPGAASRLGYPVVVKAVVQDLIHKTELGGVRLGLADGEAVRRAVADMADFSERFIVERMLDGAVAELIVGVMRHAQFGLVLVVGAGGILVELIRDTVTLLLPASRDEIRAALEGLRIRAVFDGFRDREGGDLPACVDAVAAIARYAQDHAQAVVEIDVNPLLVFPPGKGVVAVDAMIRLTGQPGREATAEDLPLGAQ